MPNRRFFLAGCLTFLVLLGLSTLSRNVSVLSTLKNLAIDGGSDALFTAAGDCSNIHHQKDQCAFVKSSCQGFNALYLELYYCSMLWKPISIALLITWLLVLFSAISVVASDFFCPNLQTISTKLQLSESMAGVTVLALGNGSSDLFSTFSAMDSGAGSLAVGELIGAAFFIVAIVSGCMGIIRPFQSQKITFTRDASFLTGAVAIMTWIVYHQQINWYHSVILVCYYLMYVCAVVFGAYSSSGSNDPLQQTEENKLHPDESTPLFKPPPPTGARPPRLSIPDRGFSLSIQSNLSELNHLGHVIRPTSANSSRHSLYYSALPRSASTNGSIMSVATRGYRRPMTPRIGIRTSVFGAIEFQDQVNHIRKTSHSSQHIMSSIAPQQRRHRQQSMPPPMWQTLQLPWSQDINRRQRASTVTDPPQAPAAPSIHVVSPTSNQQQQQQQQQQEDYFTFISAQHSQPLFHIHPSSPPSSPPATAPTSVISSSNDATTPAIPEIRLAIAPPTLLAPDARSVHSLAPPSVISDYDLFVSARQSFELGPASANPSFHKSLAEHIMKSSMAHDPLFLESPSLLQTLFPTLQEWKHKSLFAKLSAVAALPLVFIFTLTLPVAEIEQIKVDDIQVLDDDDNDDDNEYEGHEEEGTVNYLSVPTAAAAASDHDMVKVMIDDVNTKQGWNKQLLMIQCVVSTAFILGVFTANKLIPSFGIPVILVAGIALACYINKSTSGNEPPSWFWMLSFVGFFVALNWIFLLANEVVGLLQAIGQILSISEAIMGLTVFALGNSVGDFVANTAIAKMGFPTMAISACYAGPLLNMVLGVGISSSYQLWKTGGSYRLDIAPTIIVSSVGLLTVLMSTLVAVSVNRYRVTKQLGWWMVTVYCVCSAINLLLEFH